MAAQGVLEPIRRVSGRAVPVPGDDIDTDRVIPARYMKVVTFDGLGEFLFHDVRFDEQGRSKGHPLDDPRYAGASILISGANFGCGSSREHAPQAIYRAGFRAVVAESFAEIFHGNATTLGMPCVRLDRAEREALTKRVEAAPETELTLDLEAGTLTAGDTQYEIGVDPAARDALLHGRWDPIAELLEGADAVEATARELPYVER